MAGKHHMIGVGGGGWAGWPVSCHTHGAVRFSLHRENTQNSSCVMATILSDEEISRNLTKIRGKHTRDPGRSLWNLTQSLTLRPVILERRCSPSISSIFERRRKYINS
jgi:hypothetical protein